MSLNYQAHQFRPGAALDGSATASAALFADVLATAHRGGNPMLQAMKVARINHLIASCAWTDAALALLALELPRWQLRRLAYDAGEWHCALSDNREIPEWLDVAIETHHADMALAILGAILQARHEGVRPELPNVAMGPAAPDASWQPVLCDNFA
ncbi:MAG TPA: hypothetical protein VIQ05_10460 [Tardiphaga sp.]